MNSLDVTLRQRLEVLTHQNLRRSLSELSAHTAPRTVSTIDSATLLNFSSNDYLGLSRHPAVQDASVAAVKEWGSGSTASRLVCGSLGIHHHLERDLATFKGCPASLLFSTGYMAALGTIPALVGPGDCVIVDRLAHACLVDAARFSGATLRAFHHNDVQDLSRKLDWAGRQASAPSHRILVVTESVFSMDGDRAPLLEIVEAKERAGAWLMVDEAHATGVIGPGGRGLLNALELEDRVEVAMGTLGKGLGSAGGFIAGSTTLHDYLINRARTFIFSTAPAPAATAAALAALHIVHSPEGDRLRAALSGNLTHFHSGLLQLGWTLPAPSSAIIPLIVGPEDRALQVSAALRDQGLLVPAIRHPTVGRGRARRRVTLSATHTRQDVDSLLIGLQRAFEMTGLPPGSMP